MGLSWRLQNLILENSLTGAKSLFSIDLAHQLFDNNIAAHPSTTTRERSESAVVLTPVADGANHHHQKYKQTEAVALALDRIQLPNPTLTFQAFGPGLNDPPCKVHCFPLTGGKMLWADQLGRAFAFNAETRQTVMVPSLHVPKRKPFSLFVPYAIADADNDDDDDDDYWQILRTSSGHFAGVRKIPKPPEATGSSLFVMERTPKPETIGSMPLGSFQFEAVVCKPRWDSEIDSWQCQLLPPPPYVHEPEYRDCYSRHEISSYAVIHVADERFDICISVNGIGTYCLDTSSRAWRKVGDWNLPFRGRVEYVPEFKLWFGLTAEAQAQHLAAADLTDMDSQPQLVGSWKQPCMPEEEEWKECKDSQLVNLGSGRFCITRTLNASSSVVGDTVKDIINVITGVEVFSQDANGDGGEVELQMIPHQSLCYESDGNTIDAVF